MIQQQYSSLLLEKAVSEFSRLPGIGRKTALRLVLWMLRQDDSDVEQFTDALLSLKPVTTSAILSCALSAVTLAAIPLRYVS